MENFVCGTETVSLWRQLATVPLISRERRPVYFVYSGFTATIRKYSTSLVAQHGLMKANPKRQQPDNVTKMTKVLK